MSKFRTIGYLIALAFGLLVLASFWVTCNAQTVVSRRTSAVAADYYVSNDGSDDSAGTSSATAWKTIAKVIAIAAAGDSVVFNRGDEWREQLSVPDHRMSFGAYGTGANPIISGATILSSGWSDYGSNVWAKVFTPTLAGSQDAGDGLSKVFFNDTTGTEVETVGEVNSAKEWCYDGDTVFVYSTSDPATAYTSPGVEATDRYCIVLDGDSSIIVNGIDIIKSNKGGIWSTNYGDSLVVLNDTLRDNGAHGIYSNSGRTICRYVTARNNGVGRHDHGFYLGYSDSMVVENCVTHTNAGSGISMYDLGGWVRYNISYNNGNYTKNYRETSWGFGLDLGAGDGETLEAYYNIIYDNYRYGIWVGYLNAGGTVNIYNNVVEGTHYTVDGAGLVLVETAGQTINVKNNIFYAQDSGCNDVYVVADDAGYAFDYNCYYGTPDNALNYDGSTYTLAQFSTFKSEQSQETNGQVADPEFTNAGTHDYTIGSASACVDAGVGVGLTRDFAGDAIVGYPDVGAYEEGGSAATLAADATGSGENLSGATLVFTINPTVSNAGVYVATYSYNTSGSNVASVDVKGEAAEAIYQFTSGQDRVELWFADSVSSGSGNITITKGSSDDECAAAALAVINIDLETPNGSEAYANGSDFSPIDTVASAEGELVIACVGYYNKTLTEGSGETIRIANENGSSQGSITILTKAGATSTTFAPELSGSVSWWIIGVPAKP